MEIQMFSIYDEKTEAYSPPFNQTHIGQAIRAFNDTATDQQTVINRHPQDYSLYHIGTFDDATSTMVSFNEPKFLARATEFTKNASQLTEK